MKTTRSLFLATILATSLTSTSAMADDVALFDDMIVFGDSLSDPGNLPGLLGGLDIPGAPYFENQFSNGPNYVYLLDDLLGFQADRNLNFAIGGARSGPGVTQNNLGIDHVNAFLNGNGSGGQIDRFLATGRTNSAHDLFILNIGGNDYLGFNPAVDDASAVVSNAIGNISAQLDTLIGAGAQQIVVPWVANTGITPAVLAGGPDFAAASTAISNAHNAALNNMLAARNDTGVIIYAMDSTTLLNDVATNPGKYGFTNVTESCFSGGVVCANPDSYLFFDGVHPTAAGHRITAAAFADTLLSTRTPGATAEISASQAASFDLSLNHAAKTLQATDEWTWFAQGGYTSGERDTQRMSLGYDYDSYSATFGGLKQKNNYVIGAAGSYGSGDTDYDKNKGGIDTDSLRVGVFARRDGESVSAILTGSLSFDAHDLDRITGVAEQVAEASAEGRTFAFSGELRANMIDLKSDTLKFVPFVRARWQDTNIEAYGETGAVALDRTVEDVTINPATIELGADFGGKSDGFSYGLEAAWTEGLKDNSQTYRTALVTIPDVPVTITTEGTDDSYARLSGFAGFDISNNLMLSVIATTDVARDDTENLSGYLRVSSKF